MTTAPARRSRVSLGGTSSPSTRLRPRRPGLPGLCALRRVPSPFGDEREAAVLEHAQLADDAVPSSVLAAPPRAGKQRVALDAERVGELERLHRRVERVRHGHVDAGGAVRAGARALSAADRLVVGEAVVAEREVVHRPLPLGGDLDRLAEGAEHSVDDAARRLDVAGGDGVLRPGVDEGSLGGTDGDWREGAAGCRDVGIGQAADDEVAGGAGDRDRTVEVAVVLGPGAGEVDLELVFVHRHGCVDGELALDRLEDVEASAS